MQKAIVIVVFIIALGTGLAQAAKMKWDCEGFHQGKQTDFVIHYETKNTFGIVVQMDKDGNGFGVRPSLQMDKDGNGFGVRPSLKNRGISYEYYLVSKHVLSTYIYGLNFKTGEILEIFMSHNIKTGEKLESAERKGSCVKEPTLSTSQR